MILIFDNIFLMINIKNILSLIMRVDNEKDNENGNGIKKHQKVGVNSNPRIKKQEHIIQISCHLL